MSDEKTIEIWVDTSEQAMCGSDGWGDYDPHASIEKFIENLIHAVEEDFPGYKITVHPTDHKNDVIIDDERYISLEADKDQDYIKHLISQVWARQDWYVEASHAG